MRILFVSYGHVPHNGIGPGWHTVTNTNTELYVIYCLIYSKCINYEMQHAKKVVSDSPGLVDFAIGLVNSVFSFPDGQVIFF